jgi:hypothetical protein
LIDQAHCDEDLEFADLFPALMSHNKVFPRNPTPHRNDPNSGCDRATEHAPGSHSRATRSPSRVIAS